MHFALWLLWRQVWTDPPTSKVSFSTYTSGREGRSPLTSACTSFTKIIPKFAKGTLLIPLPPTHPHIYIYLKFIHDTECILMPGYYVMTILTKICWNRERLKKLNLRWCLQTVKFLFLTWYCFKRILTLSNLTQKKPIVMSTLIKKIQTLLHSNTT